ncbi:MAG: potassium channel family protein [Euryarchaeota archaeon]|nr:potassium channel family protein [Euryarchaeota archaeon]
MAQERPVPPEPREDPTWREVFFAVLAIISVLIGISRIENPLPAPMWLKVTDVAIATAFLGDWVYRISRSGGRLRYALTHSYELLFFIPFTLLPTEASGGNIVRGGRLLRLLRFARYGRYTKLGLAMSRLPRRLRRLRLVAENAQLVTLFVVGAITISLGGVGLLITEGAKVGLGSYADALWWSLSLFTTVAYAVPEPQTQGGHLVSGLLMVAGVVYVGIFTASLASAILRTPEEEEA